MKRITLLCLAVILLGFSACTPNIEIENPDKGNSPVFTAIISPETKTDIQSDGKTFWKSGDHITVVDASGTPKVADYSTTDDGTTTATFTKSSGDDLATTPYKAYYPASIYSAGTLTLPSSVTFASATPSASIPMYATADNLELKFKNICGVVKLTVNSTSLLKSITLSADEAMSGTFTIVDNAAVLTSEALSAGNGVTLNCGNLDISSATTFYIAIPAGTYHNFKMTFTDSNDMPCVKTKTSGSGNLTIERNKILPITLSTALPFPTATVTYYDNTGAVIPSPVEGVNTNFSFGWSGIVPNFKIAFCATNGNAINWANGDVLEAKISSINDTYHGFDFGDDNVSSADGAITGYYHYYDEGNHWWIKYQYNDGTQLNYVPDVESCANFVIRLSKEGLEYSLDDGENFTTGVAKTVPQLASILTRGTSTPFYFGSYLKQVSTGTFVYLKVTRAPFVPVAVTSVTLNKSSMDMFTGGHETLVATINPDNATNKAVSWSSSDPSVASVDDDGKVTAVSAGTATITVTSLSDPSKTATCSVTVANPTGVVYFAKDGSQSITPVEFDVESGFGPFALPTVDWDSGDYIEVKLSGSSATPFILGSLGSFTSYNPGNPNYGGCYSMYSWAGIKWVNVNNNGTNTTLLSGISPETLITIKVSKDKIEYKTGSSEIFTDITAGCTLGFQDPANLTVAGRSGDGKLYIGSQTAATVAHYYYIKLYLTALVP